MDLLLQAIVDEVWSVLLSLGLCYVVKLTADGRKQYAVDISMEMGNLLRVASIQYECQPAEYMFQLIER